MPEAIVTATGLGVQFGAHRAVDGVSLKTAAGTMTAVIGPNGAGKTTLLRTLAGLIPTATGGLDVGGIDPRRASAPTSAKVLAYAPQLPASAWDFNLEELGAISGRPEAYGNWLVRLGLNLPGELRLSELSGGERKCAHLALTFAGLTDPFGRALLLDEPTASLDRAKQAALHQVMHDFTRAGAAVLVATHDLAFARTCGEILVLAEGRLVAAGRPDTTLTDDVVASVWG